MNRQTSQTNLSQDDPRGMVVSEDQDGTELYDSHTPDSYDAHIMPAETAARKEHEGANFKHLAKHPAGSDSIDTTGGFKVDKEGLVDNFAIEPKMYYETREDLSDNVKQEEIHQDQALQEEARQEEARQEEIRQDKARQEEIRQNTLRQDKARQEEIRQEEARQNTLRQEEARQNTLRQEEARQDKARQEEVRQEEVRQEEARQNTLRQEEARQEEIRQEEARQDKARQEEIRQEEARQEEVRQEAIRQQGGIRLGVGTFSSYETTEIALGELKTAGFLMDRVSLVGLDINSHTEVTGAHTSKRLADVGSLHTNENKAEETAKEGAVAGSTVGGLAGLFVGLGLLAIPGIGPVMLAGAAATAIATTVSGGVIGAAAGSLVGGLVGLGIPEDRAKVYSDRISQGDYLVMVEGSEADIALAESIFSNRGIHDWHTYDLSDDSVRTVTTTSTHHLRI